MYDLLVVMPMVRANASPPLRGVLRKKIVSGWTAHTQTPCSSGSAKIGRPSGHGTVATLHSRQEDTVNTR